METQPINVEAPVSQPLVIPSPTGESKPSHLLPIILSSLITTLILFSGYFYYINFYPKNLVLYPSPAPASTPIIVTSPSPTIANKADLTHYILKDKKSSIDYPKDWVIVDNTKQEDLYQDGKPQWAQAISVSYQGYKLNSHNPLAWGPTRCLFSDSPDYTNDQVYGEKYPTYTEFSNGDNIFRRVKLATKDSEQNWGVCTKGDSGEFGGVSGFGSSSYMTPLQYNESTLTLMDQILMSIKKDL